MTEFQGTIGRTLAESTPHFMEPPHPGEDSPNVVIVLIDDKPYSLREVMQAFKGSATAVHGWRYSREDSAVAAFDAGEAAAQWKTVEPALLAVQQVFGPDHYELPVDARREGCTAAD